MLNIQLNFNNGSVFPISLRRIYLLHPRLRSPFITASMDSQPGMRLIKRLRVQTRFHTLSYGRVRSVKLAGRSFPWTLTSAGGKWTSRPTSFSSRAAATAAAIVAAILFGWKVGEKCPTAATTVAPMPRCAFTAEEIKFFFGILISIMETINNVIVKHIL